MKNNNIKIIVYDSSYKFINFLVYNNIKYKELNKNNNSYSLIIDYNDYKKISKRYKNKIVKYYGINGIKIFIKYHKYLIISFILSLFLLINLTNTIYFIDINSSDEEIISLINNELLKYDIELYKKKKSYNEIQIIKEKILNDNKDKIDWIEINEIGCKYIVDVTRRVINENKSKEKLSSDIVASKDGLIKHILVTHGTKMKEENEYVKKGEVLISGSLYKDDKLIYEEEAKGSVYAQTWYITKITIPFNYIEYKSTGKIINRYYMKLFDKEYTLLGKYNMKNKLITSNIAINKPYLPLIIYKDTMEEYKYIEKNISNKEAYNEALERSEKIISKNLDNDEYIISKKTLKKEINSSKMYVEVFFIVYENIGVASNIREKEEYDEDSNNASN